MRSDTLRRVTRTGVGVAAAAAVVATGAFGVSGDSKITRVAGIPKAAFGDFSGDGGPALRAELDTPIGVAVDRQGNLYIVDRDNRRVRKVNSKGIINTFAGGGDVGSPTFGDGGPATSASLDSPWGVAVDGQGNVYISERSGDVVRKVTASGIISTFAGKRVFGFSGDGGPATSAQLASPQGLAMDGQGNLYISDYGNGRIRKVSPNGIITTFAGRKPPGFSGDGGPAAAAQLRGPAGLATDGRGSLYIADQLNSRIRKVSPNGTITTFAGGGRTYYWGPKGGRATAALVPNPFVVAVDPQGNVYTASGRLIYKVSGGRIALLAGNPNAGSPYSGDGGPARRARLTETWGMAVDRQGNLYFSDIWTQTVRKIWTGSAPEAAALKLTLGGASPQPLLVQKGITVTASCDKPCALVASGSVTILGTRDVFGLTRASASLVAAGSTKLTLRFSTAEQRRFSRLLKPGQAARATITVRATDRAGRPTTATRIVAVRSSTSGGSATRELRTFVDRIGKILVQSASGRRELGSAITAGFNCSISARAAGRRVDRVVANRQSLLGQLRGLLAPSAQANEALALLRLGMQHSIEADIRYREGFFSVGTGGCPLPPNRNFTLARQSDTLASAAKQRFVAVFNPLARRVGSRTWSASEI